jgi:hypothetical protein
VVDAAFLAGLRVVFFDAAFFTEERRVTLTVAFLADDFLVDAFLVVGRDEVAAFLEVRFLPRLGPVFLGRLRDVARLLGVGLRLTAPSALIAKVFTASPTTLPAASATSFAPSMPDFATSRLPLAASTTAVCAVARMPSCSLSMVPSCEISTQNTLRSLPSSTKNEREPSQRPQLI